MYAIKAEIKDPRARTFELPQQKTMYAGKKIAVGDTAYIFASENEGGAGLVAKGVVVSVTATPKRPDVQRQTPLVSVIVKRTALAQSSLGRNDLKLHKEWNDGSPETELNFKLYRQATNKIVGVSPSAASFLDSYF